MAIMVFALGTASAAEQPHRRGPVVAMREQILAQVSLWPGMAVAEIGVGGGWFVTRGAEAVGPTGVVYGTDIDPAAIATVQSKVQNLPPAVGRVELRLCRDERDTALDDLPDNWLDVVLMVDSVCFDAATPRERNVAYLRRFLRILRPGGRLVHHMDCLCEVSPDTLLALFSDAGFSPHLESLDVSPDPALLDASWPCRSAAERARHAFVAVFRKHR